MEIKRDNQKAGIDPGREVRRVQISPAARTSRILAALVPGDAVWIEQLLCDRARNDLRLHRRDANLRIVAGYFEDEQPTRRARLVARELSRYAAGAWLRERDADLPPGAPGLRASLWWVMRLNNGEALAARQVTTILTRGRKR